MSHNTMQLDRFSSIDDASELGCPGLHIVLSHIDVAKHTYVATASVTANKRRFYLEEAAAVIDLTPTGDTFHPAVLDVVQPERSWPQEGWPQRGWPQGGWQPYGRWDIQWPDEGHATSQRSRPKGGTTRKSDAASRRPSDLPEPDPYTWTLDDITTALRTGLDACVRIGEDPHELLLGVIELAENFRLDYEALLDDHRDPSILWTDDDAPADHATGSTSGAALPAARKLSDGDW